jgi:anti-sigma factor ChrR (cupin superfamily)
MKTTREFFPAAGEPWQPTEQTGVSERVLSRDASDPVVLTRLARWAAGLVTPDVITHDYAEEVYLLEGELHDLTLGLTFLAGDFACRPPGMPHGPYRTESGCVMLETRYRAS